MYDPRSRPKGLGTFLNLDQALSFERRGSYWACGTQRPSSVRSIYFRSSVCRVWLPGLWGVKEEVGEIGSSITEAGGAAHRPRYLRRWKN